MTQALYRHQGWTDVIADATVTTAVELELCDGDALVVLHEIRNPVLGGYVALFGSVFGRKGDKLRTGRTIITSIPPDPPEEGVYGAVRDTDVVTITTETAHGLLPGDQIVVEGVTADGDTDFNGEFVVAAVDEEDECVFTYAQVADDDTGGGGGVYRVSEVVHALGENLPDGLEVVSYQCVFTDVRGRTRLVCVVGDSGDPEVPEPSVHTVWARVLGAPSPGS